MNGRDDGAIQRCIQFAPFARGYHRSSGQSQWLQHHADTDGISREHFADQGHRGLGLLTIAQLMIARCCNRTQFCFRARVPKHGASQHIFGFSMRRHTEAWHINADNSHAVNFFWQNLQRHTRGRRHAQIGDDYCIVFFRVSQFEYCVANVFEQFTSNQCLGIERHVTHTAPRTVKM